MRSSGQDVVPRTAPFELPAVESAQAGEDRGGEPAFQREKIVSPYPYKTAQEHYEALMADAVKRGGPTVHTRVTLPE